MKDLKFTKKAEDQEYSSESHQELLKSNNSQDTKTALKDTLNKHHFYTFVFTTVGQMRIEIFE